MIPHYITIFILTLFSYGVLATIPKEVATSPLITSPFIQESHLLFSTRSMLKTLRSNEEGDTIVHTAWGQGAVLDYQSGYLANFIGFDASYYAALKLAANDYFDSRAILYNSRQYPGKNKKNAQGFDKFGQRYAKIKFGDSKAYANIYYGWKALPRFAALTASTRLHPSTYLGSSAEAFYHNLRLRGAYVTHSMDRNSSNVVRFTTHKGQKIDHIITGDIQYQFNHVTALYFYGQSQHYIEHHGVELTYSINPQWQLNGFIYGAKGLSAWKTVDNKKREFDDQAWHYATTAQWRKAAWNVVLGVGYTQANKQTGVGYYYQHLANNSRGAFNAPTSAGTDYMRNKELALIAASSYAVTPEWTLGTQVNYGQFKYQEHHLKNGELNFFTRWEPETNWLKGLSIFASISPTLTYKNSGQTPILLNGKVQRARSWSAELVIDYKLMLF